MRFVKMQACGNDYIYVDCIRQPQYRTLGCGRANAITALCHRHFGVGGDGVVLIDHLDGYKMKMFNADGTQGATCGNALRCVAKYIHLQYGTPYPFEIITDSGLRAVSQTDDGRLCVAMGHARIIGMGTVSLHDQTYTYTLVDIGNRHAVCADCHEDVTAVAHAIGVQSGLVDLNVETYWRVENALQMRVCERGTGITLGCGSGACATVFAACTAAKCTFGIPITVKMSGGEVAVLCRQNGQVDLIGDAHTVFEGEIADEVVQQWT